MASPSRSQTNRLLGYPDDARLLIVNADDFGMCHSVNQAILRAMTEGIASSTTLMTPCPWAPHAVRLLQQHPELPFGVHLTAVRDFDDYRWRPLTDRDRVPSLVDESGCFHRADRRAELLSRLRMDELELEFRAQIEVVLAAGLRPTHLDWHCLADGGRADVFDLTLCLAGEYGLALRVHDRGRAEACQRAGRPANDHDLLDSYHLGAVDKAARYARLLRELPAGLTEWAVHPGLGDAEARTLEPTSWPVRRADLDFLVSPQARELLDQEGIVRLDYRALQAAWSRRGGPGA